MVWNKAFSVFKVTAFSRLSCLLLVTLLFTKLPAQGQDISQNLIGDYSNTDFAFKLFNAVVRNSTDNAIISPLGAHLMLCLILNGTEGKTRTEISKILGIASDTTKSLNEQSLSTLTSFNNNNKLKIANAVFIDTRTPIKASFIEISKNFYNAIIESDHFSNSNQLIQNINSWCNFKTDGKISLMVRNFNPTERMIVLNTICCKSADVSSCQKTDMDDDKFMTASGDIADVRMMHRQQKFLYLKTDTFRAIAIPYASNRETLFIFLPCKKTGPDCFQTEFNQENWQAWLDKFRMTDVKLVLPKFSFSLEQDLSAGLKSIGMTDAFDLESADFSKLVCFSYKTSISRVLQSIYLEIDDCAIGDTTSSKRSGVTKAESAVKPRPVEFRVDHPFVLALVDNESEEIVFLGSIVKP